jgi:hypothetical protein
MTFGSVLLGLALMVLVGLYLARPLLAQSGDERQRESRYKDLLALKESYLIQLRNLEFDFQTGKVPEEIYQQQRSELVDVAAELLKQIDSMEAAAFGTAPPESATTGPAAPSSGIDTDIEKAVMRRRQSHQAPGSVYYQKRTEQVGTGAASVGETKFCPQCGKKTDRDDKFCVNCGAKLKNPQPV